LELLTSVLDNAVRRLDTLSTGAGLPLLLCMPEPDRPGAGLAHKGLAVELEARIGVVFDRNRSRAFPTGHVACFEALHHARDLLSNGADACVIAAADCFISARTLRWLDRHKRLLRPGRSDGVVPGEAAAALLITPSAVAQPSCRLLGVGFGSEPATALNDDPLLGTGMARAARGALAEAGLAMEDIELRISDVAGESWAFEELVLSQARTMHLARPMQTVWHPARSVGEVGAAAGMIQLMTATFGFAKAYAPGAYALCHSSAVTGRRAAALLGR
jgi:3-oxoacyl-[acyl-carrier-protein] synthase I